MFVLPPPQSRHSLEELDTQERARTDEMAPKRKATAKSEVKEKKTKTVAAKEDAEASSAVVTIEACKS